MTTPVPGDSQQPQQPQQPPGPPWGQPPGPQWGQRPGPPGAPSGQPPDPYGYAAPAHPDAQTAMLVGILGLVLCGGLISPWAWVLGRRVTREIDASGGQLGGRSQAQTGYVLGIIGSVMLIGAVLLLGGLAVALLVLAGSVGSA